MPRKPTPRVEVEMPPDEECPDGSGHCAKDVTDEALELVFGHHNFPYKTTIISPVIVRKLDDQGLVLDEWQFPSEDWPCLQDFLESLRHRLRDIVPAELLKDLLSEVEDIRQLLGDSRSELRKSTRALDLLRKREVVPERLRNIVELERRTRARRDLAQVAGIRLHRWSHPIISRIVKQAREALR